MSELILLFFIGFIAGIFTGFFGVGGGFFLTPALHILGLQIVTAIGTVFLSIIGNSLLAAWRHLKQGNVTLRVGILLGLFSVGGVEIGKRIVLYLHGLNLADASVRIAYIVILSLISLSMLKECFSKMKKSSEGQSGNKIEEKRKTSPLIRFISKIRLYPKIVLPYSELEYVSLWVLAAAGLLIGIISGILGVGGGFISLPFLIYMIGMSAIMAVGTTLIVVFFISAYGVFTYAITGHVDWTTALVILIGSFLGIQLGVLAAKVAAEIRIKILFAFSLLCIAVSVFFKQVELTTESIMLVMVGSSVLCFIIFWPVGIRFLGKVLHGKRNRFSPKSNPDKIRER
jgi:uncharacterized membrane protein YfcA